MNSIKKNVYLAQPQYPVNTGDDKNYWLPYSVGCIWSYCTQFDDIKKNYSLAGLIFNRDHHDIILKDISDPCIVGFSCYQWNKNFNLKLAELIKKRWPDCVIVFGGPEVSVSFLKYNFVDSITLAEGEYSFLDILRRVLSNEQIPKMYEKSRVEELDYPSPYESGIFDQLIEKYPNVKWAATLETNRGCPFSCTFCDWGSLTYSKIRKFPLTRVEKDIIWMSKNPVSYIYCADANFGIFKDRDLEIARMVSKYGKENNSLEFFNATFNKNNNEESFKILKVLGNLNRGFTVSVQSLHKPTLEAIKRSNLGVNDLEKIFKLCADNQINSYTEVILGLPLETKDSFINGLCELLELGQHQQIDIWFTNTIVNSELATMQSKLQYGITTVVSANGFGLLDSADDPVDELVNIVNSTNTMSTEDMIDSYLYGWMIVNFHIQGYTQIISRYLRRKHNINYRIFYDAFLSSVKKNKKLNEIYNTIRKKISTFLYTGQGDAGNHMTIYYAMLEIYQNKQEIFDEIETLLLSLDVYDANIINLQKLFIFDKDSSYPINISCNYDVVLNNIGHTDYKIIAKLSEKDINNFNINILFKWRRKGLLRNRIEKIE
jgi:hypothetical protein